jgi:predicted DNA binding CopG/RHH family protein
MPGKQVSKIEHLSTDKRNANKHSATGTSLLNKSLHDNKFGRSILISNDNVIIAGNGTTEIAKELGITKLKIIDTSGDELIAVRRKDIKSGTPEFYNMALADNITAKQNIVLDAQVIDAIVADHPEVAVWADVQPGTKTKPSGNNQVNHEKNKVLTLHFSQPQLQEIKDKINQSGLTAEQYILKALKIKAI